MTIGLRFYGNLREIIGTKSIEWELSDDSTIESVLQNLSDEFPRLEERLTTDEETIQETILVRKNGSKVTTYDETLTDGDQLAIITQIVGG